MSAIIIAFKPKSADDDLPRRRSVIGRELWSALLGMTPRQTEMAERLWRGHLTGATLARYIEALRYFEPALVDYREELLKGFEARYPRAAKRIREGKPPRRRRKQQAC
jgi:hypothetical protein